MQDENQEKNINKPKSRNRLIPFVIFGIILLLIAGFVLLNLYKKNKTKIQAIDAVKVSKEELKREVSANGVIQTQEDATVVAKVNGTIQNLFVEEGDQVKKGDKIVQLDRQKLQVQLKSAQASLDAARKNVRGELLNLRTAYLQANTQYMQTNRNYNNINELHKIGSVSDEELNKAEENYEVAAENLESSRQKLNFREGRAINDPRNVPSLDDDIIIEDSVEVKQAKAHYESVLSDLNDTVITAPIKGIITKLPVETGNVVGPGTMIATIFDPGQLVALVNIDEVDISYIQLGQNVRIESDAFINKSLNGNVSYIAPIIKRIGDSRICETKIRIEDPQGIAKIGASCTIYIIVEHKKNTAAIPIEQYFMDKDKSFVYKLIESEKRTAVYTLKMTEIKIGIIGLEKVEVVQGLIIGDMIAKGKKDDFEDGQIIKIRKKRKKEKKNNNDK